MNPTCQISYTEPTAFQEILSSAKRAIYRFRHRNEDSNLVKHAKRELAAMGYSLNDKEEGPNKWIVANLLELAKVFSKQGHSGFSASYCINTFTKLAKFEPLGPLTGEDSEWNDISEYSNEKCWQNNRCSHVFKGADGKAYDIDGRVFRDENGSCYTNIDSRVYVDFPYTPTTEYIDRPSDPEKEEGAA